MLKMEQVTTSYGKSIALDNVSLMVPEGSVVSIIGANGAGKSTILKIISGLHPPTSGQIHFFDQRIDRLDTTSIVRKGLSLVPEGRQLFPYLTVVNNLKLGASQCRDKAEIHRRLDEVYDLFPRLSERHNQHAGTLSGGEQQMVAIGRGMMAKPKLLCMDEPSLGLAPIVIEQLGEVIKKINQRGVSVLLVEQNVHLALTVAVTGYVLQVGRVVQEGDINTLRSSDIVKKAYLGG